jgi:uncharacterized membrane protein YciS (DUF1049 family)
MDWPKIVAGLIICFLILVVFFFGVLLMLFALKNKVKKLTDDVEKTHILFKQIAEKMGIEENK